ncbi:MAG: hypothetical protein P0Y56_17120 [Candidatus Andeanibacterium colombiense]|uniref:Uncharacterized protein n=1 Tax=Candidatus Andeanibacterium colombiense TaxID=3121345 RepID=A0AAJ6BN39_9SPHN|nr:MAG: hypothetical protein P0Y56_17120 [Sphingomonadaceae bacterium]
MSEAFEQIDYPRPSKRAILTGAAVAVIGAAMLTVFAVLPAEYGIDLTGFGKATRLTEIAQPANKYLQRGLARSGVFTPSDTPSAPERGVTDHWTFELGPFEGIELKYVLDQGKPMTFFWSATGPLGYDMHAHPFDGGTDLTESYAIAEADHLGGRYVAPFSGIHGWFWQNRSLNRVTLTLDASGQIAGSKLFGTFGEQDRALTPAATPAK